MKPIKHLGQNFLTSRKIIEEIVRAAGLKPDDVILEVGPGKGILTEALLEKAKKLIAVEKDKRLVDYLETKFSDSIKVSQLKVVHDDILKFSIFNFQFSNKFQFSNYKIIANIPYYITSRFLRMFLSSDFQPSKMVLMVQKEVAERITAKDKKESILSISVKAYGEPRIVRAVPARYFSPKPKVDSAILLIDNISKNFFSDIEEKKFFGLVKQGFSSKRKLLKNNLALLMSNTRCLTECGIPEKSRAENLSLENWKCLCGKLIC